LGWKEGLEKGRRKRSFLELQLIMHHFRGTQIFKKPRRHLKILGTMTDMKQVPH